MTEHTCPKCGRNLYDIMVENFKYNSLNHLKIFCDKCGKVIKVYRETRYFVC